MMVLSPLSIPCDLSEMSLALAKKELLVDATALYTSVNIAAVGDKLARANKLNFFIDVALPNEAWYVTGSHMGVFSLGA